ncbi:MAG: family 10 glycosylhydrolase [Candidatus Methylacidiphilales bacterium]|nr:family 10 glycosylhydrolase [Candidatus Methylacidiphilales bacterium]
MARAWIAGWLGLLLGGTATAATYLPAPVQPPAVPREFRAAWVATVHNIDWPSRPGLPVEQQKAELLRILDQAAALRLNAIILQVRPSCDALYASPREPWSEFLTGKMGRAPEPFYDPLDFAVTEAHQRGIELHAWFNPYRALTSPEASVSPEHISRTRPDLVRHHGRLLWLDPGEPEVVEFTRETILDVVRRYDIDGVHIDDYFYPYPELRRNPEFDDARTFQNYQNKGGKLNRASWRRDNTDRMVKSLYEAIKSEKPWVKFGISPFGIWKSGVPAGTKAGIDAREDLYADSLHWLRMGWLDYFSPQLYWPIDKPEQSFTKLLAWWRSQNPLHRHVWPGVAADRIGRDRKADEIIRQVLYARQNASPSAGSILWNFKPVLLNKAGVAAQLKDQAFQETALTPACPWLNRKLPAAPHLVVLPRPDGGVSVRWAEGDESESHAHRWVLQVEQSGHWSLHVNPSGQTRLELPEGEVKPSQISVFAVDRYGMAGPPAGLQLQTGDTLAFR